MQSSSFCFSLHGGWAHGQLMCDTSTPGLSLVLAACMIHKWIGMSIWQSCFRLGNFPIEVPYFAEELGKVLGFLIASDLTCWVGPRVCPAWDSHGRGQGDGVSLSALCRWFSSCFPCICSRWISSVRRHILVYSIQYLWGPIIHDLFYLFWSYCCFLLPVFCGSKFLWFLFFSFIFYLYRTV